MSPSSTDYGWYQMCFIPFALECVIRGWRKLGDMLSNTMNMNTLDNRHNNKEYRKWKKLKTTATDVVQKNNDGFWFPRALLVQRVCPPKNRAFPEHEHWFGFLVLSQRKGDNGCRYRETSSPGLTPTPRSVVGRPGAPSLRLVVMPWRREPSCSEKESY